MSVVSAVFFVGFNAAFVGDVNTKMPTSERMGFGKKLQERDLPAEIEDSIGMKLVLIRPGSFLMGTNDRFVGPYDTDNDDARPVHEVEITRAFYMGAYEVTQEQFEEVTGNNPSDFEDPEMPVEGITWDEAVEFCKLLSEKEGITYRLPTEAEWEYACRAGTTTEFYWGDEADGRYGWYSENSEGTPHYGGEKLPNSWGLYDMAGNLGEWCSDYHDNDYYDVSPAKDPTGPESGMARVARGGTYTDTADFTRSSTRLGLFPTMKMEFIGFRCVREIAPTGLGQAVETTVEQTSEGQLGAEELYEKGREAYYSGDYEKAFEYFERSSLLGDPMAITFIGYMFNNGLGVEKG